MVGRRCCEKSVGMFLGCVSNKPGQTRAQIQASLQLSDIELRSIMDFVESTWKFITEQEGKIYPSSSMIEAIERTKQEFKL